jgi:hypothetical protein
VDKVRVGAKTSLTAPTYRLMGSLGECCRMVRGPHLVAAIEKIVNEIPLRLFAQGSASDRALRQVGRSSSDRAFDRDGLTVRRSSPLTARHQH